MITKIGVIASASFGWGGYQEVELGLSLTFDMKGAGVSSFDGYWGTERSDRTQWTEEARLIGLGKAVMLLGKTLSAAKKMHVEQLVGVPVEVTIERNTLVSWRILHEAIR